MPEVFIARQPIFDRRLRVAGYELLFRGEIDATTADVSDSEAATATVVLNSFTELGLEQIVGDTVAWVNVSREFILGGLARTLPPKLVVLEILERQLIDDELVDAVARLKEQGYRIALDDFDFDVGTERLLEVVDLVKLDLMALGRERFAHTVRRLGGHELTIVAEKLENHDEYAFCSDLGCRLFQGYFFCRPELVRGRRIEANKLALFKVLAALQDPTVDLDSLERTLALDIGLSSRLLRYINSAYFGLRQQVRSLNQVCTLLGIENLRRWAALSVFSSLGDKPIELTVTALVRARFCELVGQQRTHNRSRSELFTLGLFSVIDALMDTPIAEVLAQLPFPDDMCEALASHKGADGKILACVTAVEAGDFGRAMNLIPNAGQLYLESLKWADQARVMI